LLRLGCVYSTPPGRAKHAIRETPSVLLLRFRRGTEHARLARTDARRMQGYSDVIGWEREPFELINEGHFRVTDPGPLHAPIHSFSIGRNEKQDLILKTLAPTDARSSAPKAPSGTLRFNTDAAELTNLAGTRLILSGVQTYSVKTFHHHEKNEHGLTEEARIHHIDLFNAESDSPGYIIEWLDNAPDVYHWPDTLKTMVSTTSTRIIAFDEDGITLSSSDSRDSFGKHAVKIVVAGTEAFLCALGREDISDRLSPGCIIYRGTPDDEFRKRVRNALSFALGAFLVDLGSVTYTASWNLHSLHLKSAYSIGRKVYDLPRLHPAPLHPSWQHGVDRAPFHRVVNSIVAKYDDLDFGNLSWAYWHAVCATPHIAGVHFGAAIEALQRQYIRANPTKIQTKIVLGRDAWSKLSDEVLRVIAEASIPEDNKAALRQNVGALNNVAQRAKMEAILQDINIALGPDELLAWRRRNDAAHGNALEPGGELSLIKDNNLLRMIFHRMLLRITNASESYFDYATPGVPIRRLTEPSLPRPGSA